MTNKTLLFIFSFFIIASLLSACQARQTVPPPVPYETQQAATLAARQLATPTPTSTVAGPSTAVVPSTTVISLTATPLPATLTATAQAVKPADVTPTPTSPPATLLPLMTSPDYGIQAFMWWRPEVATRDLGLIKEMGFRWVKHVFAWSDMEPFGKGTFNWTQADQIVRFAAEAGIKVMARLDRAPAWTGHGGENGPPAKLADFGDFCFEFASRYKGRVHAYQVWNEPNLAREWGGRPPSPAEYAQLLKVAYQRIKEADPNALVISAGLTPTGTNNEQAMPDDLYLEGMYKAGFQQYCDLVGLHAAGFKAPPELSPDELMAAPGKPYGDHRFFCFRHVEDMRKIMEKYGDGARRVAVLEFGWTLDPRPDSPYHWHAVTREEQADYMVRAYQWAREHWQPWIGLMSLIYIADPYWKEEDEEYWWAITEPSYPIPVVRPAYEALKMMPKD